MESEDAVVVPLVQTESELTTEAMLRMLLNREALVIQRSPTTATGKQSGLVAQSGGAFAKAISQSLGQMTRSTSQTGLYQVIMPTGSIARDLVPAVGGGFRGLVRTSGSAKIAGHVRLMPAAAATGATVAAGPLIATVGLAVVGEMLAQHQINKKLDAIKSALTDVQDRLDADERAVLLTAANQTRTVTGYLLDQAKLPQINFAAQAFGDLDRLTNTYIGRLDRWLETATRYNGKERVYTADLLRALTSDQEDPTRAFEQMVMQTYEALALRARVVILEKVAAEFENPNRSLVHVESVLRGEFAAISERQSQLVGLLDDLSVMQIDASKVSVPFAGKGTLEARTSFSRLARALHAAPDSLPILGDSEQTVLELSAHADKLSVLAPTAE